ncbi:hypothetical protein T492DRAFT_576893, partial [Pavlovales sp. CCMP2436]
VYKAAGAGQSAVLRLLLATGVDPNWAEPRLRKTALHAACFLGDEACVAALLSARASPEMADAAGKTPLAIAKQR